MISSLDTIFFKGSSLSYMYFWAHRPCSKSLPHISEKGGLILAWQLLLHKSAHTITKQGAWPCTWFIPSLHSKHCRDITAGQTAGVLRDPLIQTRTDLLQSQSLGLSGPFHSWFFPTVSFLYWDACILLEQLSVPLRYSFSWAKSQYYLPDLHCRTYSFLGYICRSHGHNLAD